MFYRKGDVLNYSSDRISQIWKKLLSKYWKPSNPIKKWAGNINRFFLKEEIQMTSNLEK